MNCGNKFSGSISEASYKKENIPQEEEHSHNKNYLNIKKLDVDIINHSQKPVSFGEVLGSQESSIEIKRKPYQVKGESVVKDISNACRSSKPKDFDDGG